MFYLIAKPEVLPFWTGELIKNLKKEAVEITPDLCSHKERGGQEIYGQVLYSPVDVG